MVAAPKTASCALAKATVVEHTAAASPMSSYDRHFQTHFTVLKSKASRLTESGDVHTASSTSDAALSAAAAGTGPSSVQVLQGVLFIDGKPVTSAKSIKDDVSTTMGLALQSGMSNHLFSLHHASIMTASLGLVPFGCAGINRFACLLHSHAYTSTCISPAVCYAVYCAVCCLPCEIVVNESHLHVWQDRHAI